MIFLALAAMFGATTSAGAALLFAMRLMRPAVAKTTTFRSGRDTSPGILVRLPLMWLLSGALPTIGIAALK